MIFSHNYHKPLVNHSKTGVSFFPYLQINHINHKNFTVNNTNKKDYLAIPIKNPTFNCHLSVS